MCGNCVRSVFDGGMLAEVGYPTQCVAVQTFICTRTCIEDTSISQRRRVDDADDVNEQQLPRTYLLVVIYTSAEQHRLRQVRLFALVVVHTFADDPQYLAQAVG